MKPSTTTRNFATKPRTMREAFRLMGGTGVVDTLRGNVRYCSIGKCLTPAQIEDLRTKSLLTCMPSSWVPIIGKDNMKAMTGMSPAQLDAIAKMNDDNIDRLERLISRGLERGIIRIGTATFKV